MTYKSGASRGRQRGRVCSSRRDTSNHAMLYALDAATGKELYSSGDAIPTYTLFPVCRWRMVMSFYNPRQYPLLVRDSDGTLIRAKGNVVNWDLIGVDVWRW